MSKDKKDLVDSSENDKLRPDYFGYYTRLVTDLLSKEEDFPPFASQSSGLSQSRGVEVRGKDTIEHSYGIPGSLFGNSIGTGLSDFKKERLKSLLRQGVKVLSPEVDEMLGPVIGISQLKSQLKRKQCLARGALPDVHVRNTPSKRLKKSSSFSSTSLPALSTPTNPESSRENGVDGHTTETARFVVGAEEPKVDNDLQTLIETDSGQVEETVKKYSDEFSTTLGHMEQQLEKLLDTVMSSCRPMTLGEKHKLGKLIQKLPPKNLDHVAEMIQHRNAAYTTSPDEIRVDLERQSNITLWRLYYYVEAVEKARKLAKYESSGSSFASTLDRVVVATDDERIRECCNSFGADVVMTSESCRNGTERCSEAIEKLEKNYDIVVNIQGDEPLIEPEIIDGIVKALQEAPDAVFSTAVTSLKFEDALDPNRVKCVVDNSGYAIYFSRGLIPFNKSGKANPQFPYLLHLGIQSYDTKFLKIYPELQPTPLQLEEDLEQLKVLENGYKMKVIKVDHEAHGVDAPEDVEKIESLMRERNLS